MYDMKQTEGLSMTDRYILSVSTRPEIRARLDRLAQATHRSKSFLANEAIERYLASEEAFIDRIETRLTQAETGNFITSDELRTRFQARMEEKFKPTNQ